jgi:glycosyltransferase involved in cell wall biosynthesis
MVSIMQNQNNPKILIISGVQGDTRRYRAFHLWQQLRLANVESILSHITSPGLYKQAAQSDVVILQRVPMDAYIVKLLNAMRRHKSLIIYDTDDLLFDPTLLQWIDSPDFADPIRTHLYRKEMDRQRWTLESSDAALVSTEYLADRIKTLNKSVWIHRNAFSLEMESIARSAEPQKRQADARRVLGYASGTPTHDRDFALISPELKEVLCNHPDVELWLVGPIQPGEDLQIKSHQIRRIPLVPWRELPSLLVQFDINLAPLASDNPFSLSKSEIKYVEAGLVSVPTVASKTPAFEFAIHNWVNGCLVESKGEWLSLIEQLLVSPELRDQIGRQAYIRVMEQYHPGKRSQELIGTLNDIYYANRGSILWNREDIAQMELLREDNLKQPEAFWIPEKLERQPSMAQRANYQLYHRSFANLAGYIWIYIRRRLAIFFPFRKRIKQSQ